MRVRINYGDYDAKQIDLPPGQERTLGRLPEGPDRPGYVEVPNQRVSRFHTRLIGTGERSVRVEDLNSKGGTRVIVLPGCAIEVVLHPATPSDAVLDLEVATQISPPDLQPRDWSDPIHTLRDYIERWIDLTGRQWRVEVLDAIDPTSRPLSIEIPSALAVRSGSPEKRWLSIGPTASNLTSATTLEPPWFKSLRDIIPQLDVQMRVGVERRERLWSCHEPDFCVYSDAMSRCHTRARVLGEFLARTRRALEAARPSGDSGPVGGLPVLLRGESGSGKTELAHCIHYYARVESAPEATSSPSAAKIKELKGRFVRFDVGGGGRGRNPDFLRVELLGRDVGPADELCEGAFRRAKGGTVLLDEIGDLSLDDQVVLLKILDDYAKGRIVEPFGGCRPGARGYVIDAQIIFATWRDLEALMEQGAFRMDLYERISVLSLVVPSLEERRDEIFDLLRRPYSFSMPSESGVVSSCFDALTSDAVSFLEDQVQWTGNVRSLNRFALYVQLMFVESPGRAKIGLEECRACIQELKLKVREAAEAQPETALPAPPQPPSPDLLGMLEALSLTRGEALLSNKFQDHVVKPVLCAWKIDCLRPRFDALKRVDLRSLRTASLSQRREVLNTLSDAKDEGKSLLYTQVGYASWKSLSDRLDDYFELFGKYGDIFQAYGL